MVSEMHHIHTNGRGHPKIVIDSNNIPSICGKGMIIIIFSFVTKISQLASLIGHLACLQGTIVIDMSGVICFH